MAQEGERDNHHFVGEEFEDTPVLREQRHVSRREEEPILDTGDGRSDGLATVMQWMVENQKVERERIERREIARDRAMMEHQFKLLEKQNEAEDRRAAANSASIDRDRKRQDAMYSVPLYKEKENVEEFLLVAERRLRQGRVSEDSWIAIIGDKLTGRLSTVWLDAAKEDRNFEETKKCFLRVCGFTPKIAGETFFGFTLRQCKGLSAEEVYHKGQKLFRSLNAPGVPKPNVEFTTITAWLYHLLPRRAKAMIDARTVTCPGDLIEAVSDYLMSEGSMIEGAVATFRGLELDENKKEFVKGNCFTCGTPGHKASQCRKGMNYEVKNNVNAPRQWNQEVREPHKIICFTCNQEGHKSPQCPNNIVQVEQKGVVAKTKPLKRLRASSNTDVKLPGTVNDMEVLVLLDSGASVSIVPERLVAKGQYTGDTVWVKPYKAKESYACPLAKVPFCMGDMKWVEEVAVDNEICDEEIEILYCLDLRSARGLKLITFANKIKDKEVKRVTTRSEAVQKKKEEEEIALIVKRQRPNVKAVVGDQAAECNNESEVPMQNRVGKPTVDLVVIDPEVVINEEVEPSDDSDQIGLALLGLDEERSSDEEHEVLEIPPVLGKLADSDRIARMMEEDSSLKSWREKGDRGEENFVWGDGLLFRATTNVLGEEMLLLVLPEPLRLKVMKMAHEGMEHMGFKRVVALVKKRFIWPGMGEEIRKYCQSCEVCQKTKRQKARRAPLMTRPVLSEPFECIAFDLVGPMDPGKGGARFVLTAICLASRWPEAIPLKTVTAEDVAEGMFEVFSRTGIPLQILTDQGPQFMGELVQSMCRRLKIDSVRTAPYHPECNGLIERMHSTLNSMLTKAKSQNLDWVSQIPFALFAMRMAPNRDTGLSPFQLVYGRAGRSPLDVLYEGWVDVEYEEFDVEVWSEWMSKRLEIWSETAREKGLIASVARKAHADKKSVVRILKEGDKVLCRIPGMIRKLRESWKGPYTVKKKINEVDYLVEVRKGRTKTMHINNLKLYKEREEQIRRLTVVGEYVEDDPGLAGIRMGEACDGFEEKDIEELVAAYPTVFSDSPGRTDFCQLVISTVSEKPLAAHPHRVPDKWKEGVRQEILKMEEQGIIVRSNSPWASPIVPVPKPDGSLRICVDYRAINNITIKDPYYMVTLEEILDRVGGSGVISKIDLTKGYYQIEVHPDSMEKTTFVTFVGKFMFTRMPFGLANAPAIFQRVMERALVDCYMYAAPYIDDVLVFSKTVEEHKEHLGAVVRALGEAGLTIRKSKCVFGRRSVEYLGHRIGSGYLAVPEHRVTAMRDYIRPHTKRQLKAFLGAASYYRQFVFRFAWHSSSLSPSTHLTAPAVVSWDDSKLEAFQHLKVSLCNLCILTIPSSEDEFSLHTDASAMGIGATLNVIREEKELTVAFFSRQLQGAQNRYSATELEALAIIRSVFFFAHYLHGRTFIIITDHKALTSWMTSTRLNRRLQGWAMKLMDFSFKILYRPGVNVGDADGLSRQAWAQTEEEEAAEDTSECLSLGGDVGASPTEKEEKKEEGHSSSKRQSHSRHSQNIAL